MDSDRAALSHPATLTAGFSWYTYAEYWKVWIDYNHDGTFQEPGEVAFAQAVAAPPNGTSTFDVVGSIAIPATALAGPTRMRVTMKRGTAAPTPCETVPFGEVEDYTVNVSTGLDGGGTGNRQAAIMLDAQSGIEDVTLYGVLEIPGDAATWVLDKSTDGQTFEPLQSGEADAELDDHVFIKTIDNQPVDGKNQYRLRLFDREGKVLSEVPVLVNFEHLAIFSLFPNPANSEFFLEMSKLEGRQVTVEVFNRFGHLVYRENIAEVTQAVHQIRLDGWHDGRYLVQVTQEGRRSFSKKLMVAK